MISSLRSDLNWWREESKVVGLQAEKALLMVWLHTTIVMSVFYFKKKKKAVEILKRCYSCYLHGPGDVWFWYTFH